MRIILAMTDKEVKTENFEHCIEAQSLCLGFTSSNVPHWSVAKTIAQEAPRFLLFYQKSDRAPNYVQALAFKAGLHFQSFCSPIKALKVEFISTFRTNENALARSTLLCNNKRNVMIALVGEQKDWSGGRPLSSDTMVIPRVILSKHMLFF